MLSVNKSRETCSDVLSGLLYPSNCFKFITNGQVQKMMLQCNDGTSNKVSNIIRRHIDSRKLLLICILLLSYSLIFFRFLFYKIYGCIPV